MNTFRTAIKEAASITRTGIAPPSESAAADIFALQVDLATARQALHRLNTDFDAYKEQVEKQSPKQFEIEKDSLIREILPIIDNLETALDSATSLRYQELRQDVKIALHQLYRFLRKQGIEPADDIGQPFDPLQHELVAEQCDPAKPENSVLHVKEGGYRRGSEVFRPAKVTVNVLPEPPIGDGS